MLKTWLLRTAKALAQFQSYKVTHPENQAILTSAQAYYQQGPDHYTPLPE